MRSRNKYISALRAALWTGLKKRECERHCERHLDWERGIECERHSERHLDPDCDGHPGIRPFGAGLLPAVRVIPISPVSRVIGVIGLIGVIGIIGVYGFLYSFYIMITVTVMVSGQGNI